MPRLFYAIWPTDEERRRVADYARATLGTLGKQVHAADIHMTLSFLGQVSEEDAAKAMNIEAPRFAPFILRLGPPRVWPRGLVVIEAASPELMALQREIDTRLRALALPTEARAFRPHVTLARNAPGVRLGELEPMGWQVDSFCLVQSAPGGASKYRVLRRWPS